MRSAKPFIFLALLVFLCLSPPASAAGPFRQSLGRKAATSGWTSRTRAIDRETLPSRNLNSGRSVLPSGRSYYQGRYYGNFNNRFYGPQYGYF
jgi:hypothetical protein